MSVLSTDWNVSLPRERGRYGQIFPHKNERDACVIEMLANEKQRIYRDDFPTDESVIQLPLEV